jgi:hypothetical protein
MIGSSSEISRETCRIQNVDGESSIMQRGTAGPKVPGPGMRVAITNGSELATHDSTEETAGRSQSPHSSDEAVQQTPWSQGGQEGRYERNSP